MADDVPLVTVIDDDVSVREALRNLLRSVGMKVETYAAAQDFLSSTRGDAPGCLVIDIKLPGLGGLDLQRRLLETNNRIPIIFISAHADVPMSVRAMKAGAVEFLTKPFREQEFLEAVDQAIERSRDELEREKEQHDLRLRYENLTPREKEVFSFVVQGLANRQIGEQIDIAEPTVKMHRGRLMHKMGANSLADLIKIAGKLEARPTSLPLKFRSQVAIPKYSDADRKHTIERQHFSS